MFDFLKNHPFAVEAHFERSTVLTFALRPEQLRPLVPPCLALDMLDDHTAFLAVALVQTTGLRPAGFPRWLGRDFFLIGYRVFVRFTTPAGKRLRGLFILKSETDRRAMELVGNLFTHYHYATTDLTQTAPAPGRHRISSHGSGLEIEFADAPLVTPAARPAGRAVAAAAPGSAETAVVTLPVAAAVPLPPGSPFADWAQARRFAGPLPFTFTHLPDKNAVLVIEGRRENWQPRPLEIISQQVGFLTRFTDPAPVLASAFTVENIPYRWRKGRLESLAAWQAHP